MYLIGAFLLGTLLQVAVVAIPQIAKIFNVVALNNTQWLYTIAISVLPIIIMELQKKLNEIKFGKVIYKTETR